MEGVCEGLLGFGGFLLVVFIGGVGMVIVLVGFFVGIFFVVDVEVFDDDVIVREFGVRGCVWLFFIVRGLG